MRGWPAPTPPVLRACPISGHACASQVVTSDYWWCDAPFQLRMFSEMLASAKPAAAHSGMTGACPYGGSVVSSSQQVLTSTSRPVTSGLADFSPVAELQGASPVCVQCAQSVGTLRSFWNGHRQISLHPSGTAGAGTRPNAHCHAGVLP